MMKFYDIKAAFTSLNLAYERLINFQQFSELFLCYPPQPVRERLFWDVSHRAEPLSRLHLSPSKGISFFILKF